MDKSNQKPRKVSFLQRIAIILCGLLLVALTLEIGLRLSGFIMLSLQEYKNLQSIKEKGSCRIMCLGESTTRNKYPPHLVEILNQRNIGIKFSVIDKGMPYIDTGVILAQLESNLDKYQPDIVVTMMGCNDRRTMYYQDIPESDTWLFRHCRVYRFSRLIYMHILKKLKKEDIYRVKSPRPNQGRPLKIEGSPNNPIRLNPKNDSAYAKLGQFYNEQVKYTEAEQAFKKAIELNSRDDSAYLALGQLYRDQGRHVEAEQALKQAIGLNSKNELAYTELGQIYRDQGKPDEQEQTFKKVLEFNPRNDFAYTALGQLYNMQMKYTEAEQAFKKAIEFNPRNDNAYTALGQLYKRQKRIGELEQMLRQVIELNPQNDSAYVALGWFYRSQGRLSESEQAFNKAVMFNHNNDFAVGGLATIYCEMGKDELSREYADKANNLRGGYYTPTTISNYRKLKQILDRRKIKLVCAQYPVRSVQPLRKIFKEDENIIFVDNEKIFKDAVRKEGYNTYFVDMFGGDFGHCTNKGNMLLAENIANTILWEVFGE